MPATPLNQRLKQALTFQKRPPRAAGDIEEAQAVSIPERWAEAIEDVLTMNKLVAFYDTISDYHADPREKFYASVQLAIYFRGDKNMEKKIARLRARVHEASLSEQLMQELYLAGKQFYNAFTPEVYGEQSIWFSMIFILIVCVVYFYMAADFANYSLLRWGPETSRGIFRRTFDFAFLVKWNGFYPVDVARGQSRRWFTSTFLHESFWHLATNVLLFSSVAIHTERLYGTSRIVFISFISALGGLFISATFENPCIVVVGASGMIFGIAGLWIADMVVNFHHHKRPLLQVFMVAAFFALFVVSIVTSTYTSNYSHVGGLITGLFPSMLFLPRFGHRKIEAILPYVGAAVAVIIFLIFPLYVYKNRFDNILCVVS